MDFKSEWTQIQAPQEKAFAFISDIDNLGKLMPEQVVNWEASGDSCSFTIKGMTSLHLKVDKREPHSLIRLVPDGKSPFEFTLDIAFRSRDDLSEAQVTINAALNPMLAMMAKRPLQNLVNIIMKKFSEQVL